MVSFNLFLFFCFNCYFSLFISGLRVLDEAGQQSAGQHTLNFCMVSHHIIPFFVVGFYVLLYVYMFISHCMLLLCLGLLCASCTIFIINKINILMEIIVINILYSMSLLCMSPSFVSFSENVL